ADLTKARKLRVDDWSLWQRIGLAYVEQANWEQAAAAFQTCLEHDASDVAVKGWHALALAAAGDIKAHGKACAALLEKFGKTEDANIANDVAWFCVRFQGAVADLSLALQLAEKSVTMNPHQQSHQLNTLGAVLYRAKRCEDSVKKL